MDQIWHESSTQNAQWESVIKIYNFEIHDGRRAAGRHFEINEKNAKNSITPIM